MKQETKMEQSTLAIRQIALESLTRKQKLILDRVKLVEGSAVSHFVLDLRRELDCADSTLWKSIRSLREMRLLEDSTKVRLTEIGRFLLCAEDESF